MVGFFDLIEDKVFLSDFSESAILKQGSVLKTIRIIFDVEYIAIDLGAEGRQIAAFCLTTDVLGIRHGNILTIRQKNYTLVGVQPEGDGAYTKLILSEGMDILPDPGTGGSGGGEIVPPLISGSSIQHSFNFGDASPKPIVLTGARSTIFTAEIVITVPFGEGSKLSLGDAQNPSHLFSNNQIDATEVGEYQTNTAHFYPNPTQIFLTIELGESTTQGAGFVLLEF